MDKIIYKQKNKIALAVLVLGGVVSNVGVVSSASSSSSARLQECVTRGDNRASDTGQNGDGPLLLSSSSGGTPIVAPTPATGITDASNTPEIRVRMSGDTITTLPKGINLSEARRLIRAVLGETGRSIRLLDGIQPITNEEQFARVTGDIQCVLGGKRAWSVHEVKPTSIAEEDQGVGLWKLKTSEVYIAELATALNLPDLPEILRLVSEDPDNFMTDYISSASSSSSARLQECVTRGDNRASDTGQNGDGPLLLSSSSGGTPIVAPTPATGITDASNTPEIRVRMSGDTITTLPKGINLSEARRLIRAVLGETGRSIRLLDGIQPITNEEQFARVTGDIQCVLGGKRAWSVHEVKPTSIAEEDQGVGLWKLKTSEVYIAELATALNLPDLSRILRFVSGGPDNFMTDYRQTTFRAQFPNLNGFSPRFFKALSHAHALVMIAQVDYMPRLAPPRTTDEESRVAEALKPKAIEALQLMFEDVLENETWYFRLNEALARRINNFLAILKQSRNGNSSVHLHGEHVNLHDRCVTLEVWSQGSKRSVRMYFNQVEPSTFVCITRPDSPLPYNF